MGNCDSGRFWACNKQETFQLPAFGADPDTITMSGYSCGSWAAHMFHVINSERIKGSGIFNGGGLWDSDYLQTMSDNGSINDVSNLSGAPVYIFSGQ